MDLYENCITENNNEHFLEDMADHYRPSLVNQNGATMRNALKRNQPGLETVKTEPASAASTAPTQVIVDNECEEWEDPERSWADLVLACQEKDKTRRDARVKELLALAHRSKWTHQILDQLEAQLYDSTEDYSDECSQWKGDWENSESE